MLSYKNIYLWYTKYVLIGTPLFWGGNHLIKTPIIVHINSTGMGGVVHRHNSNANTVYILRIKVVHKKNITIFIYIYARNRHIYIFYLPAIKIFHCDDVMYIWNILFRTN